MRVLRRRIKHLRHAITRIFYLNIGPNVQADCLSTLDSHIRHAPPRIQYESYNILLLKIYALGEEVHRSFGRAVRRVWDRNFGPELLVS